MAINVNPGSPLRHVASFTSSGTWTAPAGTTLAFVSIHGAAGGGGGGSNRSRYGPYPSGGNGGASVLAAGWVQVTPQASHTVVIGANGVFGATNASGTSGGNSSFDGAIIATGGAGGSGASYNSPGANANAAVATATTTLTTQNPGASTLTRVLSLSQTNTGGATAGSGGGQDGVGTSASGTVIAHIYI